MAFMLLDLGSLASIPRFCAEFVDHHGRLDILVNNAGIMLSERTETAGGVELTLCVNHLGHFSLTRELLPLLRQSNDGRVIVVTSDAHKIVRLKDLDDMQSKERYHALGAYAKSKFANVSVAMELARRLGSTILQTLSIQV